MSHETPRELLENFYDDEGDGLEGQRLYRCVVCRKGWQIGGTFPGGPQHHRPCPVEKLERAIAASPPAVPMGLIGELEKLIEKWRVTAGKHFHATYSAFQRGGFSMSDEQFVRQETLDKCANELEAALRTRPAVPMELIEEAERLLRAWDADGVGRSSVFHCRPELFRQMLAALRTRG